MIERCAERKELVSRTPRLSEVLLKATFAPNRNIDPSIRKIDLGSLAYEAQILRDITAKDPRRREVGKFILIKNDNFPLMYKPKVIIEHEARFGKDGSISSKFEYRTINDIWIRSKLIKQQRQDLFIAATLHTHPRGMPPSSEDIGRILLNDIENAHAYTCVFVATPELNYLVFRSSRAYSLSLSDVSVLEAQWDGILDETLKSKFGEDIARENDSRLYGLKCKSNKEWNGLEAVVQQEVLNEFIEKYKLIAFTGRVDKRIVERVTG